jgi:hypothetical protein
VIDITFPRNAGRLKDTERVTLMILKHFEIPPNTTLTGAVPEELEYELWADENDAIHIYKTKELAPQTDENACQKGE